MPFPPAGGLSLLEGTALAWGEGAGAPALGLGWSGLLTEYPGAQST